MMKMVGVVISLLVLVSAANAIVVNKVIFSSQEVSIYGARCLDGSSSGFRFANATNANSTTKWYIFLDGGGFCVPNATEVSGVEDCYKRALTPLGSSKEWPNSSDFGHVPAVFSTWNIVQVPYCGGDFHSGTRMNAVNGLYYAGHNTIVALIAKLKNQSNFNLATQVVLAGGSAGAVGTYINIDYVKTQLPSTAKLGAFPNAGWFTSFFPQWNPSQDPRNKSQSTEIMFSVANSYINRACAAANPSSSVQCLTPSFSWPWIKQLNVPFFIANSYFDTNQLAAHILNFSTYNFQNKQENQYIVNFGAALRNSSAQSILPNNGNFFTSALVHGVEYSTVVNNITLNSAISNWYNRVGISVVIDG